MADELYDDIETKTLEGAKDKVARRIRSNWNYLKEIMRDSGEALPDAPPSTEELMGKPGSLHEPGIAGDLIMNRKATLTLADGSKKTLTIEEVDEKIAAYGRKHPEVAGTIASVGKLDDEIPTMDTIRAVSEATARGAESQSGGMGMVMNFLKGIGLMLLSWVNSLFNGEKALSFSEAMAQAAAPGVQASVTNELENLAARDPAAARFLHTQNEQGKTAMDTIAGKSVAGTYDKLGVKPPPEVAQEEPPVPLEDVKPSSPRTPPPSELRQIVYNQITDPKDENNHTLRNNRGQSMALKDVVERMYGDMVEKKEKRPVC